MPRSQNLSFVADVPKDTEFEHPPGAALMRRLSADLISSGWNAGEMENWRDCGWSVVCRRGSSVLEVILTWVRRGYWMLQVRPHRVPGLIGKLFNGKPSATPVEVQELAVAVHRVLSAAQMLGSPRWRWDGFPDETNSTQEPQASSQHVRIPT